MNIARTPSIPILSLAIMLAAGLSVRATLVPNPSGGDLFVGFRASSGQGSDTAYLVDIGPASSFTPTNGTTFTLTSRIGNIGQDLIDTYGTSWNTRADLYWGIFGHNTTPSSTVYASRPRDNPATQSSPWPVLGTTERNSTDSYVSSVTEGINGYGGSTATSNSPYGTKQANFAGSASYNYEVSNGASDFGSLSSWPSIEGNFGSGAANTVLDVWRNNTNGVSYRGTFSIDNSGVVTYNYQLVPEPTTLGLFASSLIVLGVIRRRPVHPQKSILNPIP